MAGLMAIELAEEDRGALLAPLRHEIWFVVSTVYATLVTF
jgi:hypothetical protein